LQGLYKKAIYVLLNGFYHQSDHIAEQFFQKLQADVASLQAQTAAISAKADSAASDASAAASNAAAANRAADSAAETNQKLDRMLNKAMMK
jgi:outer membrane murein-binding lipoprotein Lpp